MQQSANTLQKQRFFFPEGGFSLYTKKKRLQIIKLNFTERKIIFQKSTKVDMAQWLRAETLNSGELSRERGRPRQGAASTIFATLFPHLYLGTTEILTKKIK